MPEFPGLIKVVSLFETATQSFLLLTKTDRGLDLKTMADTTRYVPEHRRQTYKGKNLFKGDELRRRREEQQVEIRKLKKDENPLIRPISAKGR